MKHARNLRRVLLLEDNPGDARLVREYLADYPQESPGVVHVSRLSEAIEAVDGSRFDVILVDLNVPDSHGTATFANVHAAAPDSPVVVLSGMDDERIAIEAVKMGAQDYIPKSDLDPRALWRAMIYATERKRMELSLQELSKELQAANDNLEARVRERTHELELARREAEAASRAKSTFLANMSHELRTPMNAILGFTQILQNDGTLSENNAEYIRTINRSGSHLMGLLDDILRMAKLEAGREEVEHEPVDCLALCRDTVEIFRPVAEEKLLTASLRWLPSTPIYLNTDGDKLREVLHNLLSNAVKYTDAGRVELTVAVVDNESHVDFSVADSGRGLSDDEQKRIFSPFEQLADTGVASGTGLGLAISHGFASLLDGELTVRSKKGEGSVFRLRLPFRKAQAPSDPGQTNSRAKLSIAGRQPRVMVVDDVDDNRRLLALALRELGCLTLDATNGARALRLVEEESPHVALLDLRMPGMNGFELARRIREILADQIRLVAVSASAQDEVQAAATEGDFDAFLVKPVLIPTLSECVARQLATLKSSDIVESGNDLRAPLSQIAAIPGEVRDQLRAAADAAEYDRLLELCSGMETGFAVAAAFIARQVKSYRYDVIAAALDAGETAGGE